MPYDDESIVRGSRAPDAVLWLAALLADGQPMALPDVLRHGRNVGLSRREVHQAIKSLDCLIGSWPDAETWVSLPRPRPAKS
jgi:hypothetical protein